MAKQYVTKGKEIKRRRLGLGVTTKRVAEVLDIPEYFVKSYEKRDIISYETAEEISWFLHCEVSDIAYEYA